MSLCVSTQRRCEAPHRGVPKCFCSCLCRKYLSVAGYAGACASVCIYPRVILPGSAVWVRVYLGASL